MAAIDPNRQGVGGLRFQLELALLGSAAATGAVDRRAPSGPSRRPEWPSARGLRPARGRARRRRPAAHRRPRPPRPARPLRPSRMRHRRPSRDQYRRPSPMSRPTTARRPGGRPRPTRRPRAATPMPPPSRPPRTPSPSRPTPHPSRPTPNPSRRPRTPSRPRPRRGPTAVPTEPECRLGGGRRRAGPVRARPRLAGHRRRAEQVAADQAAHRRSAARSPLDGDVVTLGFPEGQSFLKDVAERRRATLEEGIGRALGSARRGPPRGHEPGSACRPPDDEDAERVLEAARRIFADDLVDAGEVG